MCKKCETSKCSSRSKKNDGKVGWKGYVALTIAGLAAYGLATDTNTATAGAAPTPTEIVSTSTSGLTELESRCLKVGEALTKVGVTGNDRARFMAIAAAESKCQNISNKGLNKDGTEDVCPLQINTHANADLIKKRNIRDLNVCAEVALKIKNRQGWTAWVTYSGNKHRAYVPMALKLNEKLS